MPKKTIFIVEDDPDICELMQMLVEGQGFKVKTFSESRNVEKAVSTLLPAMVIMDLWVPGIGGEQLIRNLKKKKETKNVPIILISANNSLAKIAKRSGADGFLPKPFNIKDLEALLKF